MANNRLFLHHRPSKQTICIGKRMGEEWYLEEDNHGEIEEKFREFYDFIYGFDPAYEDDFELLIEWNERVKRSIIREDWAYKDLKFFPPKPPKTVGKIDRLFYCVSQFAAWFRRLIHRR